MVLNNKYLWTIFYVGLLISSVLADAEPVKFLYHAPAGTKTVHLGGMFNDWSPVATPMSDADGDNWWECTLFLPYGPHEYRFLVDGKSWVRDPLNRRYGGAYSNSIKIVKDPRLPDIKIRSPKNGVMIRDNQIRLLAEFIPGNQPIDLSTDSTVILYDEIQQKFIYHPQKKLLECLIVNGTEGEHWIKIFIRDEVGNSVEPVELLVVINNEDNLPVAHAGFTQVIPCFKPTQLNSGLSYDADLDPITQFDWKLIDAPAGSNALPENPSVPFPYFRPDQPGRYLFSLQVNAGGKLSVSDTVDVWSLDLPVHLTPFKFDTKKISNPVQQVSLVGEFNHWQANQFELKDSDSDGIWETALELAPGEYEYKFVVNQNAWLPDPDNPLQIADGWNGHNSIKKIERRYPEISNFSLKSENSMISIKPIFNEKSMMPEFAWFQDIQNRGTIPIKKQVGPTFNYPRIPGIVDLYFMSWNKQAVAPLKNLRLDFTTEKVHWADLDNSPAWCRDAIIYEIYVRKFTTEGTLEGIRAKLPYLKALGINCIWLMPIFDSPTGHGYGPANFLKVNPEYGTAADFAKLVQTAHEFGIKVVLDFIANHSGDQHPYFKAAFENPHSVFRDWYTWHSDSLIKDRLNYGYHNDWDPLPNLNFQNPQVWHFMLTVAKYWMEFGVDGFRCDVAWGVPHHFWKTFRHELKKINPEILLLNEVLPRSPEYHQAEFDMSYDTDFYGNMLDILRRKKPIASLDFGLLKALKNYPPAAQSLRYLENHDMNRFISDFGPERTKLAATLLLTCPGTPLIYYGQEWGQRTIRDSMDWEMDEPENVALFQYYKALIHLRNEFSALRTGQLSRIEVDTPEIYAYFRSDRMNQFLILLNFSDKPVKCSLEIASGPIHQKFGSKIKLIDQLNTKSRLITYRWGDKLPAILAPYEGRIYRFTF